MSNIEFTSLLVIVTGMVLAIVLFMSYLQRQRRRDAFEEELVRELRQQQLDRNSTSAAGSGDTPDREASAPYGGYAFVDVPDNYKGFLHDTITGFEEFARLKGYRVGIAIDTTLPGKVGFRFTILDQGVTVSMETVRSDVGEYIAKFNEDESDAFDDLPIVIDPIEHERLKAALATRFTMVRTQMEMYKTEVDFYKKLMLKVVQFKGGSIGYLPVPSNIIHNQLVHDGPQMAGDTYSTDRSPGAAVGKNNTASIDRSTITIGSTLTEKNEQVDGLSELIELVTRSDLQNRDDVARYLAKAKEELTDGDPPDAGFIGRYLGKAKDIFALAERGTEIYEKAKKC